MRNASIAIVLLASVAGGVKTLAGQEQARRPDADSTQRALRVFLDCAMCNFDFMRRTITFVDWVRDREDAQVHVLVTTRAAGGGGTEFNLNLTTRRESAGTQTAIRFTTEQTDTEQEIRENVTHALELALARYVAGTALAKHVRLVFEPVAPPGLKSTDRRDDRWSSWVFSVGLDGILNGQESTKSSSMGGSLGARRITDDWKVRSSVTGNYSKDSYQLTDGENLVSIAKTLRAKTLIVRSIGDHWSAGVRGSVATSSFSNTKLTVLGAPAVEFSFFPYAESSERNFRLQYAVGVNAVRYNELTVYGVTAETLHSQHFSAIWDVIRPWGSAQASLEASSLLNNLGQHRVALSNGVDWRVFRGLSFVVLGSVSRIADQRSLPAGGVTDEQILLRRRELLTSFDYSVSMGFTFTFGSRYVNVVNPRFEK